MPDVRFGRARSGRRGDHRSLRSRAGACGARCAALGGARWPGAFRSKRAPSFGEPRHFDDLELELGSSLARASVVLAKGDLNYRRFVHDRAWPADTPVSVAVRSDFSAVALRVLKSEAVVGVENSTLRTLAESEIPIGARTASHAMVQEFHVPIERCEMIESASYPTPHLQTQPARWAVASINLVRERPPGALLGSPQQDSARDPGPTSVDPDRASRRPRRRRTRRLSLDSNSFVGPILTTPAGIVSLHNAKRRTGARKARRQRGVARGQSQVAER